MLHTVTTCLEAAFYLVGIITAGASAWKYWRNSKTHRMRWLFDLYQSFYNNPEMRKMRLRLDQGQMEFLRSHHQPELEAEFDDFLNFFEMVSYLKERGELKIDEIQAMFDYVLSKIQQDKAVRDYIADAENGYEKLPRLLRELS